MFDGRRSAQILGVAGALALASVIPAFGAASAPDPAEPSRVIEVYGKRALFTLPKLPKVGVAFLAGGELTDSAKAPVGEAVSSCTVAAVTATVPPVVTAHCSTVFRMNGGDLYMGSLREYADGPFKPTTFAVLGGTGEFSAARGEAAVSVADPEAVVYRFTITLVD